MKLPSDLITNDLPHDLGELMRYWVGQGWAVIPLSGKEPLTPNGIKDATTDEHTIARWAKQWPWANVGGSCAGKLVIDIDVRSGGTWPEDLPPTKRHISGRGDGGGHLIYALTAKQQAEGLKSGAGKLGAGVDVKTGAGSYVVLPGSTHPDTGRKYEETAEAVVFAPDELIGRIKSAKSEGEGTEVRSLLTQLLANPPEEGGRNEWLARICGHYAKMFRKQPDVYHQLVSDANDKLSQPLDKAEVHKTAQSIWNTETSGHPERDFQALLTPEAGFLVSGDYSIMTLGLEGPKEASEAVPVEWANFDLRLVGTLREPLDDSLIYECRLMLKQTKSEKLVHITGAEFGDPRTLKRKLAQWGASVSGHDRLVHKTPDWSTRLLRYVTVQEAPTMVKSLYLGWNDDEQGLLTLDGVIDANGPRSFSKVRPDPKLRTTGVAKQEYGTAGTAAQARDVLQRVCTFHDDEIVAVFGAWWAANWAKHLIRRHVSLFPVMAIEAASGAGKTTGFFSTLVGLSGSTAGEGHYTIPTLRNALAANMNGVVWVDDLDEPSKLHEIIRVLTAGGRLAKMDANGEATLEYLLVGSLVLSGESLAIRDQKAMLERCVILEPAPPTARKSVVPGREGQSQWADILELQDELRALGGGPALSGHYASAVFRASGDIETACMDLRGQVPGGRDGERHLVLLAGARILDYLLGADDPWSGEGEMSKRVAQWLRPPDIDLDEDTTDDLSRALFPGDNSLTLRILPAALSKFPNSVDPYRGGPLYTDGDPDGDDFVIWYNIQRLADWWSEEHRGRIIERTESFQGLSSQSAQLRDESGEQFPTKTMRTSRTSAGARKRFRALSGRAAKIVWLRSMR